MIYKAKWVVPITSDPIENGGVLVHGDRIAAVGAAVQMNYPNEPVTDLGNCAILPGFVNAHSHVDYTIARGRVGDMPFLQWVLRLGRYADVMNDEDFYWSSMLGLAEGIASGYTTYADASYSGQPVKAMTDCGVAGISYREVFAFRSQHDSDKQMSELIRQIGEMRDYAGEHISVGVSPHSVYLSRPELLRRVKELADIENLRLSLHVSESEEELDFIRDFTGPYAALAGSQGWKPEAGARSPIEYLERLDLLRPETLCVHSVHIDDEDIKTIARNGAAVAHCPKSNSKLGRGISPVVNLMKAGVPVGLGTDSVVSNNTLDPFSEMRFAANLQRAVRKDPMALTAKQALEMATLGGARSLGLRDEIGSLNMGKRADLVAVDLSSIRFMPDSDPVEGLVFSAGASDVTMTMAAGRELYRNGKHLSLDIEEVFSWAKKTAARVESALAEGSRPS